MRVVEPYEPRSLRIVQREGVAQPVRPFRRCWRVLDLEFYPIASLKMMMNATVNGRQKLERVFVGNGQLSLSR